MEILLRHLVIASLVLATGCVIGEEAPLGNGLDEGAGSIVNATDAADVAHSQVGVLRMANLSICSSTLITPRIAVTAAHCLAGTTVLSFTSDAFTTPVVGQVMHPAYPPQGGVVDDDDIALVLLRDPAPAAPAAIDRAQVPVGLRVLAVGYGLTEYSAADAGIRRSGTVKVDGLGLMITTVPDPSNICSGDSGGALLDGGRLVGVTSGTALVNGVGCTATAYFARVDRHYDFLAGQVAAWGETLAATPTACGFFGVDEQLLPGQVKASCNGRFQLIHQTDGNVVLYELADHLVPRWATATDGQASQVLVLQGDGNLVLYGPTQPLFRTGTAGHPGTTGFVQDDGNFVLYGPGGDAIWVAATGP